MKNPGIVVLTVLIIVFGVGYGLVRMGWDAHVVTREVDETQSQPLDGVAALDIHSSIAAIRLHTDPGATAVTARLSGRVTMLGQDQNVLLQTAREGDTVRIQALLEHRGLFPFFLNSRDMELDITLPERFAGALVCDCSAGAIVAESPLELKSLDLHSSAGSVRLGDVTASQSLRLDSSAGTIETGTLSAGSVDVKSSAGPLHLGDVTAGQSLRLNSSAGAIEAGTLSADSVDVKSSAGPVELAGVTAADGTVHSSAGSVTVHNITGAVSFDSSAGPVTAEFLSLTGDCTIKSSAGSVAVVLPRDVSAALDASTSAGHVTVDGLTVQSQTSEKDEIVGTLGNGGPRLTIHSSAGSVKITGR